MPKVNLYNQNGKQIGEVDLSDEIFGLDINSDLVYQAATTQLANARRSIAHTKDRGEVRGGGRKPWRQKGTGRARHGSIRSPIWIGGGVTFGPRAEKNYSKKINKKAKRKALLMVLSSKVKDQEIIVIDELKLKKNKTQEAVNLLANFEKITNQKSILIAMTEQEKQFIQAMKNIPKIRTIAARNINTIDLLNSKYFLISQEGLQEIERVFGKNK